MSQLVKTKIKRNLYYEIKDRVLEERVNNGMAIQKVTKKVKVYGYDETKQNRERLMEILRDRMTNHKAKVISPIIYNELVTLEVKKNGRIEHSVNGHDDQIFSWLLALYIWYEGKDLMERFGLQKQTISCDDDETIEMGISEEMANLSSAMNIEEDEIAADINKFFDSSKSMSYRQWQEQQQRENLLADEELKRNPRTREAWAKHNHVDPKELGDNTIYTIPNKVFDSFYLGEEEPKSELQKQFDKITYLRSFSYTNLLAHDT